MRQSNGENGFRTKTDRDGDRNSDGGRNGFYQGNDYRESRSYQEQAAKLESRNIRNSLLTILGGLAGASLGITSVAVILNQPELLESSGQEVTEYIKAEISRVIIILIAGGIGFVVGKKVAEAVVER